MNKNINIPLDKIAAGDADRAADEGLVESVKQHGVLQPIGVVQTGNAYRIVFGSRRLDAARKAGVTEIPAVAFADLAATDQRVLALVENIQRLGNSPLEQGKLFLELVELGVSQQEIGRRIGKPFSFVQVRVRLASLPKRALDLLPPGFSVSALGILARLPESALVEVLDSDPAAASDCELARDAVQRAGRDLASATFDANDCATCDRNDNGLCLDADCFDEKVRTAASKAIKKLRAENPDAPVVVSWSTALGADKAAADFLRSQGAHRLRGKRVVEDGGGEPAILLDGNGTIPKLVHVADVASTDGRATRHTAAGEASIDLRKRLHAAVEGEPRPVTDRQLSGLAKALAEAVEGLDKLDATGTWAALLRVALPALERRLLDYSDRDITGDLKRIAALLK